MCKAFPASPPTWGRGATEIRKGLWRCDGNDPGEGRWGGHCTSEAGLAPPPTAGLTLKTVGTLASLEAGPGPPRPTHRGSSTTRAGGPGVWVCSLGASGSAVWGPRPVTPHALRARAPNSQGSLRPQPRPVRRRRDGVACAVQRRPTRLPGPFPGTVTRGHAVSPWEPGRPCHLVSCLAGKREEGQAEGSES